MAVAAALAILAPAPAGAIGMTYDKLTVLTFSGPVQIPGATLNAGTYRFRVTNPDTSRNVMQVLSRDGAIVYGMFNTVPVYRVQVTYKAPVVTFMEVPADVAPPIKSLFYEGESSGYGFVYPKAGPVVTAPERPQPPITYAPAPALAPLETPPPPPPEPEPLPAVESAPVAAPTLEPAPVELPKTGTRLPWAAAGGLTSLLIGFGLTLLRRA
jgi:LPXTG-motif cell wall-anchored protein